MALVQVSTYVPPKLKQEWEVLVRRTGKSGSEILHTMMQRVLSNESPKHELAQTPPPKPISRTRLHIRLRADEDKALCEWAAHHGMNRQAYVLALLRANTQGLPTATQEELDTLRDSNRQLAAIGRNLNQIAHAVNIDFRHRTKLTSQTLAELQAEVQTTYLAVTQLTRRTLGRWTQRGEDDHNDL